MAILSRAAAAALFCTFVFAAEPARCEDARAMMALTEAESGNTAAIETYLELTDIDAADGAGETTLLIAAADHGMINAARHLLMRGADASAADNQGTTPARVAVFTDRGAILEMLLDAGASPLETNQNNWDLVDIGMYLGSTSALRTLVAHCIRERTGLEGSLSSHAANAERVGQDPVYGSLLLMWAAIDGDVESTTQVLQAGANPDVSNMLGHPPLAVAARFGRDELVSILLANGADPNLQTASRYFTTPLMEATRDNHVGIAEALVDAGALVNTPDFHGDNALNWATYFGHEEFVVFLLASGADPSMEGETGDNALDIAIRDEHVEIEKHLRSVGGRTSDSS